MCVHAFPWDVFHAVKIIAVAAGMGAILAHHFLKVGTVTYVFPVSAMFLSIVAYWYFEIVYIINPKKFRKELRYHTSL